MAVFQVDNFCIGNKSTLLFTLFILMDFHRHNDRTSMELSILYLRVKCRNF